MAVLTVVDCSTVIATHLSHLMQLHAAKPLGRVEVQQLVEHVTKLPPKMIEDVADRLRTGWASHRREAGVCPVVHAGAPG